MKYYIYASLFNAITSILCSLFVYFSKNKTKTVKAFFYFTLSVASWALLYFLWIISDNYNLALFFSRILNIAAIFIPLSFFNFCCKLLNREKQFNKAIKTLFVTNILFLPIALTPLFVVRVRPIFIFQYWPQAGPLFILSIIEYALLIGLALIELYKKLRISKDANEKKMLKFVFLGLAIGFVGGGTNFPLFYDIPIPPIGNIFVSFYTFTIMYAIFKYKFMDISLALKSSVIYTILISLITLFYILSIYTIEDFFKELLGYKSFLFSLFTATIIAIVFIPLKNLIQTFVEKTLFRGSYVQIAEENELLRQEVLQTERLKAVATLASGMAHEIKNPLTVIKTFSEFLPHKLDDKAFLNKFAPMITQEVDRIDNLVHELLDFARPANPNLTLVNIHHLIDSTLDFLSNDFLKCRIEVRKNYSLSKDICISLDQNQIKQALLNIILNAIDAMTNGGILELDTNFNHNKNAIQIKIHDTGIGISSADLEHIFDPFFTKKDSGTGLGLSITHEIIKKHGGKIFVESKKEKGTTFILELPLFK